MRKNKRAISLLLAFLLVFGLLPFSAEPAHAVIEGWGMGEVYEVVNPITGRSAHVGQVLNLHEVNGRTAYCIDPTVEEGSGYSEGSDYWNNIRGSYPDKYEMICRAIYCGYPNTISADDYSGYNSMLGKAYEKDHLRRDVSRTAQAATQIMVHHIILGVVQMQGGRCVQTEQGPFWGAGSTTLSEMYDDILECMNDISTGGLPIPSFANRTQSAGNSISLNYDAGSGCFTRTVTDTNGVLSHYPFEWLNEDGLSFSRSGNNLTITATAAAATRLNLSETYVTGGVTSDVVGDFSDQGIVCWGPSGEGQTLCYYDSARGSADPSTAYLAFKVDTVPVNVRKVDSGTNTATPQGDATLAGAYVGVYNASGSYLGEGTTDYNGSVTVYGIPIGSNYYTQEINPPAGYTLNSESIGFSGDIASGNATATIPETVLRGGIYVQKTDAESGGAAPQGDGSFAGIVFEIYNQSANSVEVNGSWYEPGSLITSITTDSEGYAQTSSTLLPYGTYLVKEKSVPEESGYSLNSGWSAMVYVHPGANENGTMYSAFADNTVHRGGIRMGKADAEFLEKSPQGDASLAGAEIAVINSSAGAVVVNGQSFAPGETVLVLSTNEDGEAASGNNVLPFGTYTLQEIKPPEGYLLNSGWSKTVAIHENGGIADASGIEDSVPDTVIKGSIAVQKRDLETGNNTPLGGASFEGAEFQITNQSAKKISYDGHAVNPGEVVTTISADQSGVARTVENSLPYGTYGITETAAPEGYSLNSDWSALVEVREDGTEYLVDQENTVHDSVWRGDWSFVKANGDTMERLANAVFRVTSKTTGESHIIVTDVNGEFNSTVNRLSNTNGNDAAVDSDDNVNEDLINSEWGVWFSGQTNPTSPRDASGAFPYDTYEIKELRTSVNKDLVLVSFDVVIYQDGQMVNIGTIDDNAPPRFQTMLLDRDSQDHIAAPENNITLVDRVDYAGTRNGTEYEIMGKLVDAQTGEELLIGGSPVTARTSFTATGSGGSTNLEFQINAEELAGKTVVAFVYLLRDGTVIFAEENLYNEDETLHFPTIATSAHSDNGSKEFPAAENVTIVDTITYQNLIPGISYVVKSQLINKETGQVMRDMAGNPLENEFTFKPDSANGSVDVSFEIDTSSFAGATIVAFEEITRNGVVIARHEDINDEDQTISIPGISTSLKDDAGEHMTFAKEELTLTDTVSYYGLIPGKTYSVQGILMDKNTGAEVTDSEGNTITAESEFTPTEESGSVDLTFTFNGEDLAGKAVVAFETAYNEYGVVAYHKDLTDEEQTVYIPGLKTTAADSNGSNETAAQSSVTIIDDVQYTQLKVGETYTVKGTLMDKVSGEPITDNEGNPVTQSKTFKAAASDGTIQIVFRIDAKELAGRSVVVFEELYWNNSLIADHSDLTDEDQTVKFPKIGTNAHSEGQPENKELAAEENITVVDTVSYENLTPGKTYTLAGTLKDKLTKKDVHDAYGDPVTATMEFTPEQPDGTVELKFVFDASSMENKTLVAFEELYNDIGLIAEHKDIDDIDQTVSIPKIRTTLVSEEGNDVAYAQPQISLTDTVQFSNLIPGKQYLVTGTLMNKETESAVLDKDGNPITTQESFVPAVESGAVDVVFIFDSSALSGEVLVAFEQLENEFGVIARHEDLSDEDQTVYIPEIRTVFSSKDGNKEFNAEGPLTVTDTVEYRMLKAGEKYTVTGTLMNKSTGEPVLDADGVPLTATKTFKAADTEGTVDITFKFSTNRLAGTSVVAFEELFCKGELVADHKDLEDEDQTIRFPAISTTAHDENNGNEFLAGDSMKVTDTVSYSNLSSDETYVLSGTLMDKATGKAIKDANGNEVTADALFIPDGANGTVDVVFEFDGTNLENKSLVVFEELYHEGRLVAAHKELDDEAQTVTIPKIGTVLLSEQGDHQAYAGTQVILKDTITYENLVTGKEYTAEGVLIDRSSGEPVTDSEGNPVKASSVFTPETTAGTVIVEFVFDASELEGKAVVAFEEVRNEFGVIAKHEDLTDDDQTVWFPKIRTTAYGANEDKEIFAAQQTVIIDSVAYWSLIPGKQYTLTGTLVDQKTGEKMQSNDGETLTAVVRFTPASKDGLVNLTFKADMTDLAGRTLVVFEVLTCDDTTVATHEDLEDNAQTVYLPRIHTVAHDLNGEKEFPADGIITVIDTVSYENLTPGREYFVSGTLMDKSTGNPFKDKHGDPITADASFIPESADGTVDVVFEFYASGMTDKTLVAFEELSNSIDLISTHEDINDEAQTVRIPEIRTTLVSEADTHLAPETQIITLTDTVEYRNLKAGNTYTVEGRLLDKATGFEVLDDEGNIITSNASFTAESANGSIELSFIFSTEGLGGSSIVAYEDLYNSFGVIASHRDLNDEDQTVHIPRISTVLAGKDGEKDFLADGEINLIDTVVYENLLPGETYTLEASLINKATGEPLTDNNGDKLLAETKFKAKEPEGTVKVNFKNLSISDLEGISLVAFEELYHQDTVIAAHQDIDDEDQTVSFPKLRTMAEDSYGAHVTQIGEKTVITDTVNYFNLTPGETYVMTGTLMYKSTGKAIKDYNEDKVTKTVEFVAEETDGSVKLEFVLDTRELENDSLVAFERLYHDERLIGKHEDLNDEDQSVHFPSIKTTAMAENSSSIAEVSADTESILITDLVEYRNLVPGEQYTLSGTLMNREDGGVIRNEKEEAFIATADFIPESPDGSTEVVFNVPFSLIEGKTIVVFESLMLKDNVIAVHRDLNDAGQTVTVPYLQRELKYDAGNHKGLAGAEFLVTDKGLTGSSEKVDLLEPQTVVSDSSGYFYYAALPGHQYSILETKAPDGYLAERGESIVNISANGVATGDLEIPNVHGGTIVITKTDVITGLPLRGCEITIYHEAIDTEATELAAKKAGKAVSEIQPIKRIMPVFKQVTDQKGRIYFYTDDIGIFTFKETATCEGYYLNDEEYSFTINPDLTISGDTRISNIPFGTAVMKKVDAEGNPLSGAQIQFFDEYNRYLGQGISDAKGRVYFVSPGPGSYYFREVKAPNGYQVTNDHYHFRIADDYSITGTLTLVNHRGGSGGGGVYSKTGDSQHLMMWLAFAAAAAVIAGGTGGLLFNKCRKGKETRDN